MRRVLTLLMLLARVAAAQTPITDSNYAIELYEGTAIGDSALTGMGGAGAARTNGSAGSLINASAPAVRRSTDNDSWSWDYHLDALTGRFSTDYDNNGQVTSAADGGASLGTAGLSIRRHAWAIALTGTVVQTPVDNSDPKLTASSSRIRLVYARYFPAVELALGGGIQGVNFDLVSDTGQVFGLTGGGLVAGATWMPAGRSYRVAVATESRIISSEVAANNCKPIDPMDPEGPCRPDGAPAGSQTYILPQEVEAAGKTILGFAYRFGATPWNQQIKEKFQDERSVTVTADLVVTGSTTNGHGIEAFAMGQLQRSGAKVSTSPRAGVEVEALPGRLRLRGGSYWEPARFKGVDGRIHGTFGIEGRWLEFHLWGVRRGKLGATFDFARRYRNIGLSIGFWH